MKTSIGFIGGGRITKIFLEGFKNKSVKFDSIKVYEPNSETLDQLTSVYPGIIKAETPEDAAHAKMVIIAVHPPVVSDILEKIAGTIGENTLVVSLAPKITIDKIASKLETTNIIRMIPNATSYINDGYNPVAYHTAMHKKEKKQVNKVFKVLGKLIETDESRLEGYAIVSAMLPTYFWFQWKEMEAIATQMGLSEKEAKKAVHSTLKKSLRLYYKSGLTPDEVMDLIPVKPIGENEEEIKSIFNAKLLGLYEKMKP